MWPLILKNVTNKSIAQFIYLISVAAAACKWLFTALQGHSSINTKKMWSKPAIHTRLVSDML